MRKQTVDFPGIIIGIVIGLIFGFLINSRLRDPILAPTISEIQTDDVVLLQVFKSVDPTAVQVFSSSMAAQGIDTIYVHDGDAYYVYHAIAKTEEELGPFKTALEQKQIPYAIKKQSLINFPNNVIGETDYAFWNIGVANFLLAVENKPFVLDEDYLSHPVNSDFHKNLVYLSEIRNMDQQVKNSLLLETYKMIVENLS